ncbi:hypothetical protein, partial [Marinobacter sp.]|uniref:hypothetical protein n=1 Tax=Marinobacter sp. TaxID=50741 RepID=UPI00258936A9
SPEAENATTVRGWWRFCLYNPPKPFNSRGWEEGIGVAFPKNAPAAHPCGASAPPSMAPQIFGKATPIPSPGF